MKLFPEGEGKILINDQSPRDWADGEEMVLKILAPLELLGFKKHFDFEIRVSGGGKRAQADAICLGISRTIIKKDVERRPQLREAGHLTRDPRIKERKKPGLKKARRAPQWSKR